MGCVQPGCKTSSGATGYCEAHATALLKHLQITVDAVMDDAQRVYLGRTAHPERRLLEHQAKAGRNNLAVLHWAANWRECDQLERELIARNHHRSKLENISEGAEGRHSGHFHAIYVSWTWKAAVKPHPLLRFITIADLPPRARLWPEPEIASAPVFLRTQLNASQAQAAVDAWWTTIRT